MQIIKHRILIVLMAFTFLPELFYGYSFDTTKYKGYIDTLSKIANTNPEKAIKLGKELFDFCQKNKYNEDLESVLNSLSMAYYFNGDRKECLLYLNLLNRIYSKKCDYDKLSLINNRIGAIYHDWSLFTEAMNYYNMAYKHAQKSKNLSRMGQCFNNLGLINKDQGNYDKAFEYFIKAKEIYTQLNDKRNLAYTINNLGIVYKKIKSYDKALSYFKESAEIKKDIGDNRTLANSYGNMAEVYMELKDYDNAEQLYKNSVIIRTQLNDKENLIRDLIALAKLYAYKGNFLKSEEYLNEVNYKKTNNFIPELRYDYLDALSVYYEQKGDFKEAFQYFKSAKELSDSINNEDTKQKAIELEYIINTEQREKEISNLRLENQVNLEQLRKELTFKYVLLLSLVLIFSILLVVFIRLRFGQKTQLAIQEKNIHIEKINEELVSVNDELEQRVSERTDQLEKEMKAKEEALVKLETALKKAEESNFLKDAFLSNINHEIRTPLSAIVGLSEVLRNKISNENSKEIEKYIDGISQSSNRLLNLLNNIIDLSRVAANDIKPHIVSCDVNSLIRKVGDLFVFRINEKKLELSYNIGEIKLAFCDNDLLFKVLADVLDNAVKYTDKGRIEISTSMISNNKEVMITISDTGIGIEDNYLPHIFETFRQESMGYDRLYQGAGLGLPLSQRMVKLMGGRIEISSKKNFGTNVSIILPVSEIAEHRKTHIKESVEVSVPEMSKVLLVEDDDFNALFIKTIVEQVATVEWVKDGNDALKIINESSKPFDLVILDINLPNEWEGVSLQKAIREKHSEYNYIPFIAQTAYSFSGDKERILSNGFAEYFSKPINSEYFLNTVKILLVNKKNRLV